MNISFKSDIKNYFFGLRSEYCTKYRFWHFLDGLYYERNTYQEVIAFLKKLVFYNQLNVIMFIYFQNKF